MYPRLNPKSNHYRSKIKNPLNILNDKSNQVINKTQRQLYHHYHSVDVQQKVKLIKMKTIQNQKYQSEDKYEKICKIQQSSRKQNIRHSVYFTNLPQKFNHLRGKCRSLQMALMLYKKIQDQNIVQSQDIDAQISTKNRNKSFLKLNLKQQNERKNYMLQKIKFRKNQKNNLDSSQMKNQENKILKYCQLLRQYQTNQNLLKSQQFKQNSQKKLIQRSLLSVEQRRNIIPVDSINNILEKVLPLHSTQNFKQNQYNFIPKPVKKKSFFKTKIIDQILHSNIDQWQNNKNEVENCQDFIFF